MLKFHAAQKDFVLEDISASAFRDLYKYKYFYSAEMQLFPDPEVSTHTDAPSLDSTVLAREVLMSADKWGVDELYHHFVQEISNAPSLS